MSTRRVQEPVSVSLPSFGVAVLESHHAREFRAPKFRHAFVKVLLVIDGKGTLRAGSRTFSLGPDVLVHIPAGVVHEIADAPGEPMSLYGAAYDAPACGIIDTDGLLARKVVAWRLVDVAPHLPAAFRSDFRAMLFEQWAKQPGWETALRARLADLVVRAMRMNQRFRHAYAQKSVAPESAGRNGAARVEAYLARLPSGLFLRDTLDDGARATLLSRRRFTDLFRAATGESFRERVQQMRIDHARRLLAETDKTIVAVAFESGFDDPSHFHRVFKRVVGCSPAQDRHASQSKPSSPSRV